MKINFLWPNDAMWQICVNIGSGSGFLPDSTKPLPEPMLTSHWWGTALYPSDKFYSTKTTLLYNECGNDIF